MHYISSSSARSIEVLVTDGESVVVKVGEVDVNWRLRHGLATVYTLAGARWSIYKAVVILMSRPSGPSKWVMPGR